AQSSTTATRPSRRWSTVRRRGGNRRSCRPSDRPSRQSPTTSTSGFTAWSTAWSPVLTGPHGVEMRKKGTGGGLSVALLSLFGEAHGRSARGLHLQPLAQQVLHP